MTEKLYAVVTPDRSINDGDIVLFRTRKTAEKERMELYLDYYDLKVNEDGTITDPEKGHTYEDFDAWYECCSDSIKLFYDVIETKWGDEDD